MDLYIFSFVLVVLPVQIKMFDSMINPKWIWFLKLFFQKKTHLLTYLSTKIKINYKPLAAQVSDPGLS